MTMKYAEKHNDNAIRQLEEQEQAYQNRTSPAHASAFTATQANHYISVAVYAKSNYAITYSPVVYLDNITDDLPEFEVDASLPPAAQLQYVAEQLDETYGTQSSFPQYVGSYSHNGQTVRIVSVQLAPFVATGNLRPTTINSVTRSGLHRYRLAILLPFCVCRVQGFHIDFADDIETLPPDQQEIVSSVVTVPHPVVVAVESDINHQSDHASNSGTAETGAMQELREDRMRLQRATSLLSTKDLPISDLPSSSQSPTPTT